MYQLGERRFIGSVKTSESSIQVDID